METIEQITITPRHERERFICNATASAILLYLLFQIIIIIGVSIVSSLFLSFQQDISPLYYNYYILPTITNIATVISTIGGMGLAIFMVKNILKIKFPSLKNPHCSIKRMVYYTVIAMGLSIMISFGVNLVDMLLNNVGISMTTPDFTMKYDVLNNVLILISTCLVAPILEELLFRGLILTALKRFGNTYAIIVTSLLFALVHGNLPQSIPTFFMSIVLSYVVLRTKSLLPAIFMHFINNVIGVSSLYISDNEALSILFVVFEIIIMLCSIVFIIRKKDLIKQYFIHHKDSTIRSYFKHIAPILVLTFCFISILISFTG